VLKSNFVLNPTVLGFSVEVLNLLGKNTKDYMK